MLWDLCGLPLWFLSLSSVSILHPNYWLTWFFPLDCECLEGILSWRHGSVYAYRTTTKQRFFSQWSLKASFFFSYYKTRHYVEDLSEYQLVFRGMFETVICLRLTARPKLIGNRSDMWPSACHPLGTHFLPISLYGTSFKTIAKLIST